MKNMSENGNNNDDGGGEHDIDLNDSVSNVSKYSNKRYTSNRSSTTSSVKIKAATEGAALVTRMAVLKERHALEEQEQQIKRKKEQLALETELAASDAKLAVLQVSEGQGRSQASVNGMSSYFEREKRKPAQNALNPMAKECEPASCKIQEQRHWSMPQSKRQAMEPKPLQTPKVVQSAITSDWVTQNRKQHMDNQHKDQPSSGDVVCIMSKQNEITAAFIHQSACFLCQQEIFPHLRVIHFGSKLLLRHLSKVLRKKQVKLTAFTTWSSSQKGSQKD